ncbi:tetratricopeptide repeat protein [Utexia brackfieldae]|uniref:tetratricopeptide repeat protein n=1 Tax=Utexia brackfieldae TaxID=3074108 RepID=UPI00370D0015
MGKHYFKYLTLFILSICFTMSLPVYAESIESSDIKFVRIAAEKGDSEAQYHLALAYDSGQGVAVNHETAVYWYQKAAENGYLDAMFNLAVSYDDGDGIKQDKAQAIFWYTKAAEQGDPDAQNNLAIIYEEGDGTDIDYDKAHDWYLKSAKQANSLAQFNLADFYYSGLNQDQPNYVEAYAWYTTAAKNNEIGAEQHQQAVFALLSDSQKVEAQQLAEHYLKLYTK